MKFRFRYWIGLCLVLAIGFSVWLRPAEASLSLVDPRINRLESQVRSLQSQVTRLQSQIPRTANSRPTPNNPPPLEEPSVDQQFDTLAVLLIELQNRVSTLEARMEAMPGEN